MLKIVLIHFLLICFASSLDVCKNSKATYRLNNEITSTISILKNTLQQLSEDSENLIADVVLGVIFTKTNLQWSVDYLSNNLKNGNENLIYELIYLTDYSESIVKDFFAWIKNKVPVLDEKIWENSAGDMKENFLTEDLRAPPFPDVRNCSAVGEYLLKGLTANDSDSCIEGLFSENCKGSEKCWSEDMSDATYSGYKTTHRLLYMQIAKRLKCDRQNPQHFSHIESLIQNLCSKILSEANEFEKHDYPFILRDLFFEQIALCGLEGFSEFAKPSWRDKVISWQTETGCFDNPEEKDSEDCVYEKSKRQKREDSILSNGCHSHVTAVAISALSFHLRAAIAECY